jgi:hypothetical protein
MRLFRQKVLGEWAEAVKEVISAIDPAP